jgi:hypothetical protein
MTIDTTNITTGLVLGWLALSLLGLLVSYALLYLTIRLALRPSTDRIVDELRDMREVMLIDPGQGRR